MGQLLLFLIVPPIVGVVTYAIVRFFWESDEDSETARTSDQQQMPESVLGSDRPGRTSVTPG